MADRYDIGMSVEYVSDNLTQFRLPDDLSFMIFEGKKKRSQDKKVSFLAFCMDDWMGDKNCIFFLKLIRFQVHF